MLICKAPSQHCSPAGQSPFILSLRFSEAGKKKRMRTRQLGVSLMERSQPFPASNKQSVGDMVERLKRNLLGSQSSLILAPFNVPAQSRVRNIACACAVCVMGVTHFCTNEDRRGDKRGHPQTASLPLSRPASHSASQFARREKNHYWKNPADVLISPVPRQFAAFGLGLMGEEIKPTAAFYLCSNLQPLATVTPGTKRGNGGWMQPLPPKGQQQSG